MSGRRLGGYCVSWAGRVGYRVSITKPLTEQIVSSPKPDGGNQMSKGSKGGINIGNVARDVSFKAGGDVVAGDKVTNTTLTNGFKQEEDKQQFVREIEELRNALREIQTKVQEAAGVSQQDKDKIVTEVVQQVIALKTAKEEAEALPVGQAVPADKCKRIASYLQSTETLLDETNEFAGKAVKIGTTLRPYIETALPLLLSARHLFGMP